jgi:hypothetical protein
MNPITRRDAIRGAICVALFHRTLKAADPIAWQFVREDIKNLYAPLPNALLLADCKWFKEQLAILEQRIKALSVKDAQRFRERAASQRKTLQSAARSVSKAIEVTNTEFNIQSISTVVGCALTVLGIFVLPEATLAVAALVGIQLLAGVGFSAWSLIASPKGGEKILIGYGLDKSLTLVGIVADQGKTLGASLLSRGLGVLGPYLSAKEAIEANATASKQTERLNALLAAIRQFDASIAALPNDDEKVLNEGLKPLYLQTRDALSAFVRDNTVSNCQVQPKSGPVLRPRV